ncbi:hypothetical protein NDU88_009237 [Pleurodeles waltl]|uniref:Uncharacterized protein n=1 Tax=Pleurodeles waltl TaxID=8319 RepID=A0AAV7P041_PLEWA|nr:hypothetical protein NDU88_009237 [Pleurodeles waltl]
MLMMRPLAETHLFGKTRKLEHDTRVKMPMTLPFAESRLLGKKRPFAEARSLDVVRRQERQQRANASPVCYQAT